MSHTPGPWAYRQYEGDVVGSDGKQVAEVALVADARLIAAAPDLLEALERLRELFKSPDVRIEARNIDWFVADSIYGAADAAIAKARGEV